MSKFRKRDLLDRNLVILAAGEIIIRCCTFFTFVYLARVLELSTYGLVELTLAIMMFCNLIVEQGFGTIGTREIARHPDEAETWVKRVVSSRLIFSIVTFILIAVASFFLPIESKLAYLLLGYGVTLFGIPFFLNWLYQGRKEMLWVALPQIMRYATFLIFVFIFIKNSNHVLRLPLAEMAAISIMVIIYLNVYGKLNKRITFNIRSGFDRTLFAESLPIGASQMIWVLRMYLPTVLIGVLVNNIAVGYFGAAHRIMMVFQGMMTIYFINMFPTISQASYVSQQHLAEILRQSIRLAVLPVLGLALTISFAASTMIGVVFGEKFMQAESITILSVLIWIILVLMFRFHGRSALIVLNRQSEETICSLIGLIVFLAVLVPLTKIYGAVGSAWSMVISEIFATVLIWWRLKIHMPNSKFLNLLGVT